MNVEKEINKALTEMKNSVQVTNLPDYFALPIEQRTKRVWYWPSLWYIAPCALSMDDVFAELFDEGEAQEGWGAFRRWAKKEHPVQYLLRNFEKEVAPVRWLKSWKYRFVQDVWYPYVECLFKPRNKHISKVIPRVYECPFVLMERILYAFIVNYVEHGMEESIDRHIQSFIEQSDDPNCGGYKFEKEIQQLKELKTVYFWIKNGSAILQREIDESLDIAYKSRSKNMDYNVVYGEHNRLEELMDQTVQKHLNWIVNNRSILD